MILHILILTFNFCSNYYEVADPCIVGPRLNIIEVVENLMPVGVELGFPAPLLGTSTILKDCQWTTLAKAKVAHCGYGCARRSIRRHFQYSIPSMGEQSLTKLPASKALRHGWSSKNFKSLFLFAIFCAFSRLLWPGLKLWLLVCVVIFQ